MKKITYQKPTTRVVKLQQQGIICGSPMNSVNSNVGFSYRGGGTEDARARSYEGGDDWDDEW